MILKLKPTHLYLPTNGSNVPDTPLGNFGKRFTVSVVQRSLGIKQSFEDYCPLSIEMGKVKAALGGCAAYEISKKTKEHHDKKHH